MLSDVWITILFPGVCFLFTDECVILNAQTHNMDSVDCKADTGCPKDLYLPSDLWRCKFFFAIRLYYVDKMLLRYK